MQYTPGFTEGEMSQKNFGAKGECIHVLRSCGVHQARLHQCRTLCFRFTWSLRNSQPCSSDNCLKYTGGTLLLLHTEPAQQSTMLSCNDNCYWYWKYTVGSCCYYFYDSVCYYFYASMCIRLNACAIISRPQFSMPQCEYASMCVLLFLCLNECVMISMAQGVIIFIIMQASGPTRH